MSTNDNRSWARDIRRRVVELIVIFTLLVVIAASYDFWSHVSIERVYGEINNYHLMANSQYLRAMEELHSLQSQRTTSAGRAANNSAPKPELPDEVQQTTYYLINEKINSGLALERQFNDQRFQMLSNKIAQLELLDTKIEKKFSWNSLNSVSTKR